MRIVSLLPSATDIICALGLRDYLVGVTHECNYPASVIGLPVVTKTLIPHDKSSREIDQLVREQLVNSKALYSLDMEVLRTLKPDILVTQALCEVCAVAEEEVLDAVCQLPGNPEVINLEPMDLKDVFDTLLLVGDVTHSAEVAKKVVSQLQSRVDAVIEQTEKFIPPEQRPGVIFLEWIDPLFNAGHWTPELIEYAGGKNIMGNKHKPAVTVDWDSLIKSEPDVMFIACCGYMLERTLQDMPILESKPGWDAMKFVKNGRVYITDGDAYFSSPGPRLVDSLEILANALHPDIHPLSKDIPPAINYCQTS